MTVQERIRNIVILEEMKRHPKVAESLGLRDVSKIKVAPVKKQIVRECSMK